MDFIETMAFAVLFALLKNPKTRKKFYPAFAKLYVGLEAIAKSDLGLASEVEMQQVKVSSVK